MWSLCIDHEGNIINNPNEIAFGWTFDQVLTALDIKDVRSDNHQKEMKRLADSRKNAPKKSGSRRPKR